MSEKWRPPLAEPSPGRLYVAANYDDAELYIEARRELSKLFGKVDFETPVLEAEGLLPLYATVPHAHFRVMSFERLVGREELVDVRRKTMQLEGRTQSQGLPRLELDPGYVCPYTVVRSSLSEDFHRIYLYHGIFAETLYRFEQLAYRPFPHTPEFYRRADVITIFADLRLILTGP